MSLKRQILLITGVVLFSLVFFNVYVFSQGEDKGQKSPEKEENAAEKKQPTREEILERVNKMLMNRKSLRDEVPGIRLVGDTETGYIEFNGTRIDLLDTTSLKRLMAITVNTSQKQQIEKVDRLHRQLMNVQNVSRVNANVTTSVPVSVPPQPPRAVYIPTPPPAPPRIPPPPPRSR